MISSSLNRLFFISFCLSFFSLAELHFSTVHFHGVRPRAIELNIPFGSPYGKRVREGLGKSNLLFNFATRKNVAFAYGLIDEVTYHDLDQLNKMRNRAAHFFLDKKNNAITHQFSFCDDDIKDRLFKMRTPANIAIADPEYAQYLSSKLDLARINLENPDTIFFITVVGIHFAIMKAISAVQDQLIQKLKRLSGEMDEELEKRGIGNNAESSATGTTS